LDNNIYTRALQILSDRVIRVDKIWKQQGKTPYGRVKATPKEQYQQFLKLKAEDVQGLVDKYGRNEVNEYFRRMMQ